MRLMIHQVDDFAFEDQVLCARGPVLVEFFTSSCGSCRQIEPHLQKLAQRFQGKLKVVKVNSDQSAQTAMIYKIKVAPTFILFLNGEIKSVIQGAPPINRLVLLAESWSLKS